MSCVWRVDYEIIEVNGFKIKRRKSQKEKQSPKEKQSLQTPQRTPNVEEYEISAALYNRLTKALHDFPESAPPSSRLLAVCSSVCAAEIDEVRGRGDEDIAVALESVFGDFMDGIAGAIDNESIKMASIVEPFDEDFKIDIASRRIGLQRRLDILEKVCWNLVHSIFSEINLIMVHLSICRKKENGLNYWKGWTLFSWMCQILHVMTGVGEL